jgi:hypothetical protein
VFAVHRPHPPYPHHPHNLVPHCSSSSSSSHILVVNVVAVFVVVVAEANFVLIVALHHRPMSRLSLYFLMGLALVPQTREPAMALSHPMARALYGTIGIHVAMSWGHCTEIEVNNVCSSGGDDALHVGWKGCMRDVVDG